jgi:alkylated DNA repair dioxygenase AlkB
MLQHALEVIEPALPAGLRLALGVMTPREEAALIALIEASEPAYYAYDPGNRRASASFGWKYNFQTDRFAPCSPMPAGFSAIAAKAAAFAGIGPDDLAECLLNRYEPGAIIQPHLDKPVWEHVVGISLGAAATMIFRHGRSGEEVGVELPPRSMYLLAGDARHLWQHGLPPMAGTRWSITFRSFSAEGRKRLDECSAAI